MYRPTILVLGSAGLCVAAAALAAWVSHPPVHFSSHPVGEPVRAVQSETSTFAERRAEAGRAPIDEGASPNLMMEFQSALETSGASGREERLNESGFDLARSDLVMARKAFDQISRPGDRRAFLTGMIESWSSIDADGALKFVQSLPPSAYKADVAQQALVILARSDFNKAMEWLPKLVNGKRRDNAAMKIIATLATYDLKSALDYADARPSEGAKVAFAEMAAAEATRENPATALRSIADRVDLSPGTREAALEAIAGVWAMRAGASAASWAEGQLTGTGASRPLELALINWATGDAPAAADALSRHLAESWSAGVAQEIAASWADQEPDSAARWVAALPDSPARDAAMEGFVAAWSQNDPLAALKWAIALPQHEPVRDSFIVQAGSALRENGPADFDAFVKNLPHTQQVQLKQMMETASLPRTALFMDSDSAIESR